MYILTVPQCGGSLPERETFIASFKSARIVDAYADQLHELFLVRNPKFRFIPEHKSEAAAFIRDITEGRDLRACGTWFYLEWAHCLVHCLPEAEFFELRTARNRNLITRDEQQRFYSTTVAVAGLSVGSHCALTIAMMGGACTIRLADPDSISVSNLNRTRYGIADVGENKATLAARQILEMNPYAQIEVFPEGVDAQNAEAFTGGVDVLVEEVDNLAMKFVLRTTAKRSGIPVVMATDNGDGVIVDVERYDLDRSLPLFGGAVGDLTEDKLAHLPPSEMPRLATKIAGPDHIVPRMQSSLLEVGRTLFSWPQLGSAATLSGVVVAYLVRAIVTGENVRSGKYAIDLDAVFDGDYHTPARESERRRATEEFLGVLGLAGAATAR